MIPSESDVGDAVLLLPMLALQLQLGLVRQRRRALGDGRVLAVRHGQDPFIEARDKHWRGKGRGVRLVCLLTSLQCEVAATFSVFWDCGGCVRCMSSVRRNKFKNG